jgi:hypothetical protein
VGALLWAGGHADIAISRQETSTLERTRCVEDHGLGICNRVDYASLVGTAHYRTGFKDKPLGVTTIAP